MNQPPFPNGDNRTGRDRNGRFSAGNSGGPGNPHARKVAALRTALMNTVSEDDLQAIVAAMVEAAKGGDIAAAREVLDRVIGKAVATDLLQRIEALEMAINERYQHVN
jgi:hypothetical protein